MTTQVGNDRLAVALAEQLKSSLLQITKLAEQSNTAPAEQIILLSQHSLRVIDAYTLGHDQARLPLEPLTAASVLYDAAEVLDPLARQLGYTLLVDAHGIHQPVLTHRQTLKDMLVLLATGLMQTADEAVTKNPKLVLATHRSRQGTVVGAFCESQELNQTALTMAERLGSNVHQPTPVLSASGGAALAIAMQLSQRLEIPLKARTHGGLRGVGSLLSPSNQLSLVV